MGNKLVLRRRRMQVVDDKYTRPQGLYEHKDVDQKKLRKLILDSKLAPCYPGDEECTYDLEECPICFLHYPSLNRSRCCAKGICTECFLQMKPPHSTRPTQCPFCKTSNYVVEYHGARSKEEKGMEQIEEQRVIEAKIRMQRQELLDGEERMQSRQESSSSRQIMTTGDVGYRDIASSSLAVPSFSLREEGDERINYQDPCVMAAQPSHLRLNGGDQSDLDLEDIMVMEAIWLSIQENGMQRNLDHNCADPSETFVEDCHVSPTTVPVAEVSRPSSSLACATVATLRLDGDCSSDAENASTVVVHSETGRLPTRDGGGESYDPEPWVAISPESGREWETDHGSEMAGVAFSYASSDATVNGQWPHDDSRHQFQPNITMPIMPDNFEEQMMLATAISLAETRARTSYPGVAWN